MTDSRTTEQHLENHRSWDKMQRNLADLVKPLVDRQFKEFDQAWDFRCKLRGEQS